MSLRERRAAWRRRIDEQVPQNPWVFWVEMVVLHALLACAVILLVCLVRDDGAGVARWAVGAVVLVAADVALLWLDRALQRGAS